MFLSAMNECFVLLQISLTSVLRFVFVSGVEDRNVLPSYQARRSSHPVHSGQNQAQTETRDWRAGQRKRREGQRCWVSQGAKHGRHGLLPGKQGGVYDVQWVGNCDVWQYSPETTSCWDKDLHFTAQRFAFYIHTGHHCCLVWTLLRSICWQSSIVPCCAGNPGFVYLTRHICQKKKKKILLYMSAWETQGWPTTPAKIKMLIYEYYTLIASSSFLTSWELTQNGIPILLCTSMLARI